MTVGPHLAELPLPSVAGFSVTIALGATPPPAPASATAATSASPHASASLSPSPSVSPVAAPSGSAAPSTAPSPGGSAAPAKTSVKTIIYPDDAPPAPSPAATGDAVTFVKRVALVRGFVQPARDIPLYGLGAVRFTIPATEQTAGRGYTVAAFGPGKKHHETLLASDASATLAGDSIASADATSLVLKKGTGYAFVLYGDELPATPPPATAGYPGAGNNPFPTPTPTSFPGIPSSPNPYGTATSGTPNSYPSPNPYGSPH